MGEGGPRRGSGEGSPVSGSDAKSDDGRTLVRLTPHLRAFACEQRRLRTLAEDAFWRHVRGSRLRGLRFRRQVPLPPYIAEFLCASARVIVELDKAPHDATARRDRDAWLREQGFEVLPFPNDRVLSDLASVLRTVGATVEARLARASSGLVALLSRPGLTAALPSPAEGGGGRRTRPAPRP
ncbi:endonuclease domain-containing protein [Methylobacterium marchantiae]|uniref:Endonuclease domain-containing protein n=1 Tax=Methylobacterium marchantiae TaxID=600331 RepID=A0ABW3X201_9HYPH